MSMIGAALGQPEQAQTLIDETGAYFEKQAADHPQFQGKPQRMQCAPTRA
ncbi:hypothetical protein ACETU7_32525 [Rhodococcus sp. 3Y1]